MFSGIHWIYFVIAGAITNTLVNLGFKNFSATKESLLYSGLAYFVTSATLIICAFLNGSAKTESFSFSNWQMPTIIFTTGVGLALSIFFFLNALARGPFGLVNASVLGGMIALSIAFGYFFFKEHISLQQWFGVGFALLGIILMAK